MQQIRRLAIFPDTTEVSDNALHVGGHALTALAERFGTPLYIYDRSTLDSALESYRAALRQHYPGQALVTYAAKAFLCLAVARWARDQGIWVDCAGVGELTTAAAGRLPASSLVMHGVNKSEADLESAIRGAGTLVIDNVAEVERLGQVLDRLRAQGTTSVELPSAWLRLQPGVTVATHHSHTQTGQLDSKFGMVPEEISEVAKAARNCGFTVEGLHFHLGSNFRELAPLERAVGLAMQVAEKVGLSEVWHFSPGGGWGSSYHEDELPPPSVDEYVRAMAEAVVRWCRLTGMPLPVLHIEPGRSLIARAGVAVYRVGTVKRRPSRTWLLVDGGMADNPRYALYGARYSCLPVSGIAREMSEEVSIGGPYCESGDVLVDGIMMPRMEAGELLAIPVSGAYQLSMASNYNGACRPAVVWLEGGRADLIVRRETPADLRLRDVSTF